MRFRVRRKAGARNDGFSLVELVLVAVIIAVFAALAVPRYAGASARHRVDSTAARVAADLRLAQFHAKVASCPRTVCFYAATDEYLLLNIPAPDGTAGDYRVLLSAEPYRANLVSANFNGDIRIIFNGWGLPNCGGTVVVSTGSQQRTITVDGETGLVSIQ